MWLTNLAPDIQEAILFLPRIESGPDTVKEIEVRWIARVMDWGGSGVGGIKLRTTEKSPAHRYQLRLWTRLRGLVRESSMNSLTWELVRP